MAKYNLSSDNKEKIRIALKKIEIRYDSMKDAYLDTIEYI